MRDGGWFPRRVLARARRLLDPAPGDAVAVLAVLGLVILILFLRRPDGFTNPQLWAEDGTIFLSEAQEHGALALWRTYRGYHLIVPRLVAWMASQLPLLWTPALYNLAALGGVVFAALYVLSPRVQLPYKGLMALALVFCPHRGEVFMNLSNVQWVLSLALLLLVVSEEPETPWQRAFDAIVLVLVGLTGPFVILFLPLLLWRLARRRTRWSAGLVVLAGVLAALQASSLETERLEGGFEPSAVRWMMLVGRSFAGLLLLGDLPFAREPSDAVLVALSVALYALFALHCVVQRNATVALLLAGGLAIFATTAYAYRSSPVGLALHVGVRYWYVPMVTLLWAASAALRSSIRPVAAASAAIWVLATGSTLSLFAAPRYTDFHWRAAVACAERRGACVVPINPPGFQIRLVSARTRTRD